MAMLGPRRGAAFTVLLIASSSLTTSAYAQSQTIISNFSVSADGTGSGIAIYNNQASKAAGFTIAQGESYKIDSVTMRLAVMNTSTQLTVNLYGNVGSNPGGAILDSFQVPAISTTGTGNYTFAATSRYTLTGGSTYWIAATGTSPDITDVYVTWLNGNPDISPTGLATTAGYRFNANGVYPPTGASSVFNTYSVQATSLAAAAPEAGSWALMIVGFGIVGYAMRRRRVIRCSLALAA